MVQIKWGFITTLGDSVLPSTTPETPVQPWWEGAIWCSGTVAAKNPEGGFAGSAPWGAASNAG